MEQQTIILNNSVQKGQNFMELSSNSQRVIKKKPYPQKLRMYGCDEQIQIDRQRNPNIFVCLLRLAYLVFYDIAEFIIHFIKFLFDYFFCCRFISFLLRITKNNTTNINQTASFGKNCALKNNDYQKLSCLEFEKKQNNFPQSISSSTMALDQIMKYPSQSRSELIQTNFSQPSHYFQDKDTRFRLQNKTYQQLYHLNEKKPDNLLLNYQSDVGGEKIEVIQDESMSNIQKKNNLVLDLDETLVHCDDVMLNDEAIAITVQFRDAQRRLFLHQRSYLQEFLEESAQNFNIYIYTASTQGYAEEVVKHIDPRAIIKQIFSRDACYFDGKQLNKNLHSLGIDLDHTVMIDNSPSCVQNNILNSIQIKDFISDKNDTELRKFSSIIQQLASYQGKFQDFIIQYQR